MQNKTHNLSNVEPTGLKTMEHIYSVSQLNATARMLIEESFQTIWVEGEISNHIRASSGHLYFSLKDRRTQIRCAFFKNRAHRLTFQSENGQKVLIKAQVSLYEPRGDFQLIVLEMQLAGNGALQVAFEQLKEKLRQEGLFDSSKKKPLPRFPKQVGIITSPSGAAIQDVLKVLKYRFPLLPVIIYPTLVQGKEAASQICQTIYVAIQRKECDLLILTRGGGSLEDLWPFNEESVARAIFEATLPIVTGIGHEIDFTIADMVSDQRAPTPSAAAELISPDGRALQQHLNTIEQRFLYLIKTQLQYQHMRLKQLSQQLKNPKQALQERVQQFDCLEQTLLKAWQYYLEKRERQLQILHTTLINLNPMNILNRGYAIVMKSNKVVKNTKQLNINDQLHIKLSSGTLDCMVENIE